MYDVEQTPILWLLELLAALCTMFVLQLVCGAIVLIVIRYRAPLSVQYALVLFTCTLLGILSTTVVDRKTHLSCAIMSGLSFGFVTPLRAFAHIHQYKVLAESNPDLQVKQSSNWFVPSTGMDVVLHIAIPASFPSSLNPPDASKYQLRRAIIYLTAASLTYEVYDQIISHGGLLVDLYALTVVTWGACGMLNLSSALLGSFGQRSARPFRSPLTSPSITQFWAGRWNAPVSDSLRFGVYDPLLKAGVSRATSTIVCFLISGISHEIILLYAGVRTSKGEWLTFFTLSGVATIVERYLYSKIHGMRPVKRILSTVVLFSLFHIFFVPVTLRTGLAKEGVRSLAAGRVVLTVLVKRAITLF